MNLALAGRHPDLHEFERAGPYITVEQADAIIRESSRSGVESDRKVLLLIDGALERLEAGTYGVCVHCGSPVQEKRLEAVPWARHCLDCQELQDKGLI